MVNIKVLTLALSLAASSIAVAGSGGPYLGGQATYSFYDESIDAEGYGYKVYGGYRFGV